MTLVLTLRVNESLIEISAEQRVRKVAEEFLQQGGHVVGTLIGSDLRFSSAIEVFPQLIHNAHVTITCYARKKIYVMYVT